MSSNVVLKQGMAGNVFVRSITITGAGVELPKEAPQVPLALHIAHGSVQISTDTRTLDVSAPHLVWVNAGLAFSVKSTSDLAVVAVIQAVRDETGAVVDPEIVLSE